MRAGDIDALITLWRTFDGDNFVFSKSDDRKSGVTTVNIVNVRTHQFVRGTYHVPMPATTPDANRALEKHLSPAAWGELILEVETNTGRHSAKLTDGNGPTESPRRDSLRREIDHRFLHDAVKALADATASGSPGANGACVFIGALLNEGQDCKRDKAVRVTPMEDDCDFDAALGYPCPR